MFARGELYEWGVDGTESEYGGVLCVVEVECDSVVVVFHTRLTRYVLEHSSVDMKEALYCVRDNWWRKLV